MFNLADVWAIPPDRPYRFDAGPDRRTGYRAVSMRLINRKREAAALLTPEEIFKIREHMIHTSMKCSTAGGIQGG